MPHTTTLLLGVLLMAASPSLAAATDAPPTRVLTDFASGGADLGWYVVNDNVMGGRSQGDFTQHKDALRFEGRTNTNGGGFSSIRTRQLQFDLSEYEGIRVRVRADGRRYTWRLTTDARWRGRPVSYWADFQTLPGEWIEADIPFKRFKPQFRGMQLSGPELDPRRIRGMGLMIYDKQDGPFELRLDSVSAYTERAPFSLSSHRGKHRVLVLTAPSADDALLQAQMNAVAANKADFEERDMLLVLALENGGSSAGGQALTDGESAALRQSLRAQDGMFALYLVGKDGGVKRSAAVPMAMQDLYDLIDSMPMRQAEKQERSER